MTGPLTKPFGPDDEFFTDEGCHILEMLNIPQDPDVSVARARVEPGIRTRLHRLHGIVERYLILEGQGEVEVGGEPPVEVGVGDVVHIPALCPQRIANTGDADLVFLAVCTPRFTPGTYQDIE